MAFWVYMLQCADLSYYVGHTNDLQKRVLEHQTGELHTYTATRRPVRVVFTQEFLSREEALTAELQIKGWSRKKKQALIRGDWPEIARLARHRQPFAAR
jgi:predicted GIY-YIG superfamily endonuclease